MSKIESWVKPNEANLALLKDYATFLKAEHLPALARKNLEIAESMQIPLLEFFRHLPEEELLQMSIQGLDELLSSLQEGTAMNRAVQSLEQWEKDEMPGLPRDAVHPRDLVLVHAGQRQTLMSFIPYYTQDAQVAIDIFQALDSFYTQAQTLAVEVLFKMRAELLQSQAQLLNELQLRNQDLKDFAYVVSHDLKAPLRAIGSLAGWLVSDYQDKLDAQGQELVRLLLERTERMHNLIEGILEYSKIGRIHEQHKALELEPLLLEVADSLDLPAHIQLKLDTPLPTLLAEPTRIRQLFSNLIGNAAKFMDKAQGEISVSCQQKDEFWEFAVSDNGPGIAPKHYEKVFQLFQTLQARDEFESTGIGLTLVKKIVELYGGSIWLESELGQGSSFIFSWPAARVAQESAQP